MKRALLTFLLGALLLAPLTAAETGFNGRWRLDPSRSSALDGWTGWDLVVNVNGSKVALRHDMAWRSTKVTETNTVDTAAVSDVPDFFRVEQRHMAVYARPKEAAHVQAGWLDDGRTLRVEAQVPVEISQGNTTMRVYSEYRLVEGDNELVLIELHNTRNRPLVYRFKKVPSEAANR